MTSAEYHSESAEPTLRQIDKAGLLHHVIGGGRIKYESAGRHMKVYGHSLGYPWPGGVYKNEEAAEIIRKSYPQMTIEWSNDGY